MVRRNELACRDEWSRSLWQPREGQRANGDPPFQRPVPSPLPPALPDDLRSVLNHDMTLASSAAGEDVLLSEARIVSETHEPWEPPPRPFAVGGFDPRTALFRARETYRERLRAKAAAERQSAGVEAIVHAPAGEVAPTEIEPQAADPLNGSEPVATDTDRERAVQRGDWPMEAASSGDVTEAGPQVDAIELAAARESVDVELESVDVELMETAPRASERPRSAITDAVTPSSRPIRGEPADRDRRFELGQITHAERHPDPAVEVEPLPEWYRGELPRICRTCRDYRPAADGQRGWCANTWAFTHRRVVLEDDPAPCQSAIGDWWLPVDDVWLVAADVSSHGRSTPLLDRQTGTAQPQRRRS